jgi:hypothetical protein
VHALGTVELHPDVVQAFYAPLDLDWAEPRPWIMSQDAFNRAIVGGIGSTLLQPSLRFRDALARRERPQLDGRALGREAAAGVEAGYRAFVDAAVATPEVLAELREGLTKGFRVLPVPPPAPFSATTIRIVAERLQVSDPSDPLLIDGYFTLTVRARVDESVIASTVIERIEVPESGPRGVIVPLDLELAPFDVMEGDRLIVEVLAGEEEFIMPGARPASASDTVEGRPADWLGSHLSNTAEPWRLWYRIERVETTR